MEAIRSFLPWRSAPLGLVVALAFAVLGVPVFLRMPPWADVTLYDVAAANLLRGGAHYRDVFDTNTPGFVWALACIRAVVGWSYEALRACDLAIVAGIALVLDRFARDGGASRSVRAWTWASLAAFYLFLTELCHAQRDVWMLLPALLAVRLRWLTFSGGSPGEPGASATGETATPVAHAPGSPGGSIFRNAFFQGLLWGMAVWIKPHVMIPAALVWLATSFLFYQRGGWRGFIADFLGNLLGGALLGALGLSYLRFSGSWEAFLEVNEFWTPSYLDRVFDWSEIRHRARHQDAYFPPWSYFHWLAMPVAFAAVLDGLTGWVSRWMSGWLWNTAVDRRQRLARLFPAALYLGWTLQAAALQREFHYVHVAEIFLILNVTACQRWAVGFATIAVLMVASVLVANGWFDNKADRWPGVVLGHDPIVSPRHPITTGREWVKWRDAWRFGLTKEESLARMWSFSRAGGLEAAPDWVELNEIAGELARRGAKDGDVIAWNDSTHPVFLLLKQKPALRYMHVRTFQLIGKEHEQRIFDDAKEAAKTARFVVSDLRCLWINERVPYPNSRHDEDYVVILPPPGLDFGGNGVWFPYERPVVYRSGHGAGRYLIHDLQPGK
jgi:hypothetical protein